MNLDTIIFSEPSGERRGPLGSPLLVREASAHGLAGAEERRAKCCSELDHKTQFLAPSSLLKEDSLAILLAIFLGPFGMTFHLFSDQY